MQALRYYDQIGLLPASARNEGSHGRYTGADRQRLYRICVLRHLGFGLEEIAAALDDPACSCRRRCAAT